MQRSESNPFSEKMLQEFLKTANTFAQDPWGLIKTQHWLEQLCEDNTARKFAAPLNLEYIFQPDSELLPLLQLEDRMVEAEEPPPNPPTPRKILTMRPKKKAKAKPSAMKRPAAAASVTASDHAAVASALLTLNMFL